MNSACRFTPDMAIKTNVKTKCDIMLRSYVILGGEDATAIVFKIQPFAGLISYHRLCPASTEYLPFTKMSEHAEFLAFAKR